MLPLGAYEAGCQAHGRVEKGAFGVDERFGRAQWLESHDRRLFFGLRTNRLL